MALIVIGAGHNGARRMDESLRLPVVSPPMQMVHGSAPCDAAN